MNDRDPNDFARIEQHILSTAGYGGPVMPLLDLHKMTAAALYSVPYSQVDKEMRAAAKVWNFKDLYGDAGYQPPSRQQFITMFSAAELKQIQIDTGWDGRDDLYDHVFITTLKGKRK